MQFQYNDGGREQAGYKGTTGDCGVRAVSIATGKPYQEVYNVLNEYALKERPRTLLYHRITGRKPKRSNSRTGVYCRTLAKYLKSLGWTWVPTMYIGSGCKVHLKKEELPSGKIICRVSRHYVAVVDGVINDNHDCSRNETRCVYGYFKEVK